jgi:hypothetical protein
MNSDPDATRPLGEPGGAPGGAPRPVRDPALPQTPAGARAGSRDTAGPAARPGDSASPQGDPDAPRHREPAGARGPATHRPATDATSSFDRSVLWAISTTGRLVRAWRALAAKQRLAAYAAFGLFVGLFLPWYSQTVVATGRKASVQPTSVSLSGWDAFSLVQTVVLLVSVGVLVLLYERGEGHTFRLPVGDGSVIMAAGSATSVLIVWGIFDRPGTNGPGQYTTATGIEWGIFIALALAALLAYAGSQIRATALTEARARAEGAPRPRAQTPPAPQRPRRPPVDDVTRVSNRVPYDQPTPVSTKRTPVDSPTRVSNRRAPADDETKESPTGRLGPSIVPEDPPTLRIARRRARPAPAPQRPDGDK